MVESKPENATKGGNLRAPSVGLVVKWSLDSWNDIPVDIITPSFSYCGINQSLN